MSNDTFPTVRSMFQRLQFGSPDGRLPRDIEDTFLSSIRVGKGIARKTYAHRLDDVNQLVNQLLPAIRPLRMMDIGISSGVSTLEWIESVESRKVDYYMYAVDVAVRGVLVSLREGIDVLTDSRGRPLLIDLKGRWIPYPPGKRHLVRFLFSILLIRSLLYLIAEDIRECAANPKSKLVKRWFTTTPVPLVYSDLGKNARVTVLEGNLLERATLPKNLHVVRAANILNRSYFNEHQVVSIVDNLRSTLCPGGILVVCRTDDSGRTNGTVFRLSETGSLEILERINGGSEIEASVCAAKYPLAPEVTYPPR